MNRDEAKQRLMIYRPETADAADPQVAEALALAGSDAELSQWLAEHCARQNSLREKFRQVSVPDGLMEQIVSEQAAQQRMLINPRRFKQIAGVTAVVVTMLLLGLFWLTRGNQADDTLAIFKKQMASYALRIYAMDLQTADAGQVRDYFKQHQSPADYTLSGPLQHAILTGCAIEGWHSTKVSMICFSTGKQLAPGTQGDLWLFIADQASVKNAPPDSTPQFSQVNRLVTATWAQDGKVYLLGTTADESVLRKFL
jgi:hypothetical protein